MLLIDADLRRPTLHKMFSKDVVCGLAELLEHKGEWSTALLKIAREHLFLLPAGNISERSPDLVGTGLQTILEHAYEEFDLVVLDGPPLLGCPRSLPIVCKGIRGSCDRPRRPLHREKG